MLDGEVCDADSYCENQDNEIESGEKTACSQSEARSLTKSQVFFLNVSWFGLNAMYLVLSIEVFPSQVHALVGSEDKGQVLGAMIALGAVVTFFVSPLIGMKSDRLVFKYGRRRPFMVAGMCLLVIALYGMAFSAPYVENEKGNSTCSIGLELKRCLPYLNLSVLEKESNNNSADVDVLLNILSQKDTEGNVVMYVVFYTMVMACYALVSVPYNGLIADLTPPQQRGFSSGVMGAMTLAGNITGAAIGLFFFRLGVVGIYSLVCFIFVICVLITVFCSSELPLTEQPEHLGFKGLFLAYWEPLKDADFRWVFMTRFLMQQGVATVTGFLEFWLNDMVSLPHCWSPERSVALILLPLLLAAAGISIIAGFLSDALQRRKPLVTGSAILMSICALIFACLKGKYAFYASIPVAVAFGIGFGAYCAIDFALVMDVLPEDKDKAKDLAVWHQALVLPQAVATPIGGIILDVFERYDCHMGLGYIILFTVTSFYFALSGIFVIKIKKAK
ncbi:uncharacterized protein LOC114531677 [Dendronephthya gigantea]|uniref:uncharacterized protein LOC114531677 n=1 Tax=Dendronephthya gigantea TaxID=151771 RepID=UPI00106B9435|nr:uncharacterized protein LOC114531677 [Dendronephthya gigantea]